MDLSFPLHATFLALPLENEPKWQFQALQEELKDFEDCLRLQNPQTPHVTLQYWKEVGELEYQGIREQAEKIAFAAESFIAHVTQADTFGSRDEDKVLFLEVGFSEELASLRKACPWSDNRPFHPHITIARIKHPQKFRTEKKKIMKVLDNCSFDVPFDCLRLYAEIDGRKQTPLEDFGFND